MIRVLVAEDSPTVRALLVAILQDDPEVEVVGQARDGREAIRLAVELRPDLITMDVNMPLLDGLEATKEIMVLAPAPILIVSSRVNPSEIDLSLSAVRAGALMVVQTPDNPQAEDFPENCRNLRAMVRAMAQVKVVRRWARGPAAPPPPASQSRKGAIRLVALAASTGGPAALQRILEGLPRDLPVPIVVVQHIARGFVGGLSHWLSGSCDLHVKVAEEGEPLLPRTVYLAPDDRHLGVNGKGQVELSSAPAIGGFRPSATHLFRSASSAYGATVLAVILTGMGRDGVEGLRVLKSSGGRVFAQDEASSVVYGMPREAVVAGVVDAVLPLAEIAPRIVVELDSGEIHDVSDSGR